MSSLRTVVISSRWWRRPPGRHPFRRYFSLDLAGGNLIGQAGWAADRDGRWSRAADQKPRAATAPQPRPYTPPKTKFHPHVPFLIQISLIKMKPISILIPTFPGDVLP